MIQEKELTVLVADQNFHVRELIKREMAADGYRIRLTGNGREVIDLLNRNELPDLLILDPDLPDTDVSLLLKELRDRSPPLQIIIHGFVSAYNNHQPFLKLANFVEKGANSIEILKTVARNVLKKPERQG